MVRSKILVKLPKPLYILILVKYYGHHGGHHDYYGHHIDYHSAKLFK